VNNIIILLIPFFFELSGISPKIQKFPDGVYLTHEQFKNQTPAFNTELKTIIRSSGDLFWSGGNDYKFESPIDSLDSDYIKKKIYAYVKKDSVFINCGRHKLQSWYALAITNGNFIVFRSSVSTGKMIGASALGGAIGGAMVGGNNHMHVLSLRTGNARELDKKYLTGRLEEHPTLLEEYNLEKNRESSEILLKYIDKLNLITDPFSEAPPKK